MTNQTHNLPVRSTASTAIAPARPGAIPMPGQIDMQTIWGAFRRRWLLMLITLVAMLAVGVAYLLFVYKPVYESEAQLVVSSDKFQNATSRGDDFSVVTELVNLAKRRSVMGQISVITSPDLLSDVAQRLGYGKLQQGYGADAFAQGGFLPRWALNISSPKDSDLIIIHAKSYDSEVSADLANTVARTYLERDLGFSTTAAKQGREFVSMEMANVQKQLAQAKTQLAQFKKSSKLITANTQLETLSSNYQQMRYELDKANIEAQAARKQAEGIRRELVAQGQKIDQSQTLQLNPQYQQALSRLEELNAQRARLMQDYTSQSPEVQRVEGQIAAAQQVLRNISSNVVGAKISVRNPLLDSYLKAQVDSVSAATRANSLSGVVAQRSAELQKLPDAEKNLSKILQQVSVLDQTYAMLSQKYYQLLVNEKSTLQSSLFVATALPALSPVYTKKQLGAVVFLIAIVLAIAVAAVAERIDNRIRDNNTVARSVGELPLSVIPNQKSLAQANIFEDPINYDSPFSEAFRILRNNLVLAAQDQNIKTISITSPGRAEGKSTVALNLAVSMATDNKKVLIVDCDLRRPSLHRKLGIEKNTGLTNLVNGLVSQEQAIVQTKIEGLFVLPSGPFPGNPSEFLNSTACRETMRSLAEQYDIVIVDCPPCAGLSDMQVISTFSDGVLLVVTLDTTREDSLEHTIQTLALVEAPFLGVVTNKVSVKKLGYDYYGYPKQDN